MHRPLAKNRRRSFSTALRRGIIHIIVNGKPHTWPKKVPPLQAASINYSNVFNLQYSGIFSDHGNKSSM